MNVTHVDEKRVLAARRWIQVHSPLNRSVSRRETDRALIVLVFTYATSDYLAVNDPQALRQAQVALMGDSWEDYVGGY